MQILTTLLLFLFLGQLHAQTGRFIRSLPIETSKIIEEREGKIGVIDLTDEKVIVPFEFDKIRVQPKWYLEVKKGDVFGLFDFDGNEILPVECTNVRLFPRFSVDNRC